MQHVTVLSTLGTYNTIVIVNLNISKHRKGIVNIWYERLKNGIPI